MLNWSQNRSINLEILGLNFWKDIWHVVYHMGSIDQRDVIQPTNGTIIPRQVLQIPLLGTQNPLQNHLQKGIGA